MMWYKISVILCLCGFATAATPPPMAEVLTWTCTKKDNVTLCKGVPNDNGINNQDKKVGPDKYTIMTSDKFSRKEALQACNKIGTDLVSIETEDEWLRIKDIIANPSYVANGYFQQLFWTAGGWLSGGKKYMWPNGREIPYNASYWNLNQPSSFEGAQDCITIDVGPDGELGLDDWQCGSGSMGYICESRTPDSKESRSVSRRYYREKSNADSHEESNADSHDESNADSQGESHAESHEKSEASGTTLY